MPRDPSSTPCEKAIPEPHIQVSICSCIRSGYKSENVHYRGHGIQIYIFPAGVHHVTQHARSLWPDTPFWGQCPASEDQHVVVLPRLSREVPAGLHPKHSWVLGPFPAALLVVVCRVDTSTASDGQHDPIVPQC